MSKGEKLSRQKSEKNKKDHKIKEIIKRDGTRVKYNREKISDAIFKAARSVGGTDRDKSREIAKIVEEKLIERNGSNTPTVEQIQDLVEKVLIETGHAQTAKAYILYRNQRTKRRIAKDTFLDVQQTIDEYLYQNDWRVKENSNTDYSFSGLMLHTAGKMIAMYALNEIYPETVAKAHREGRIHIHDLSGGIIGYCSGWSLSKLLNQGFGGVTNKAECKPAKHLDTVVHQMVNYVGCLQMEFAGAQAFSVHPKETIILKDTADNVMIKRIGDFVDYYIDRNGKQQQDIELADIAKSGFKILSFDPNGNYRWKKVKKVIRHPITDPLHMIKTNKGPIVVSKNHSVFSLKNHTYLGSLESKIVGLMEKNDSIRSDALTSYGLPSKRGTVLRTISNLKAKGIIKNSTTRRGDGTVAYSTYSLDKSNEFVLRKTKNLKTNKEVKSQNISSNLAVLSDIDLDQKEKLDLYSYILSHDDLKSITRVYGEFSSLKDNIQQYTSLRQESLKLSDNDKYLSYLFGKGYLPIGIFERYKTKTDLTGFKLGKIRKTDLYDPIIRGAELENLVKLIAWYITEGWAISNHTIGFSQTKEEHVEDIKTLLESLKAPYHVRERKRGKLEYIVGGFLGTFINKTCGKYCDNKKIPSFIFDLSNHYKNIFIRELLRGDGYKRGVGDVYTSTSNLLITGLNLLSISMGYRTSIKTRFERNYENCKVGWSTKNKEKLTRYDLIIHSNSERILNYKNFNSAVIFKNEERAFDASYEYDISVEDTETFIGGVGLFALHNSSVDTYLAPFVRADNLTFKEVKQNMQRMVFSLNIPSRWGSQTPFSNLTFDWTVPDDLKDTPVIVGGEILDTTYGDYQKEMDMINRAFLEVMQEGDADGRIFTFPIPTYNLTPNFNWDSPNAELLFKVTAKYGTPYFQNYIGSNLDPSSIRAMCCRLQLDQTELLNRPGGMWSMGESTGSVGVVSINLNRIGYEAKTEAEFFEQLAFLMDLARDSLEIKRELIIKSMNNGLVPYTKVYLGTYKNHFSTIGLVGMNEACVNFLDKDIASSDGLAFAKKVLNFMRDRLTRYQQETGNLYNLEASPAEGASYRLARFDKKVHPTIYTAGSEETPYLTNSTQLPVDYSDDVILCLEHQDQLQPLYTGGTIFHTFLGERLRSGEAAKTLIKKIAHNTKIPYFSLTPTFSICKEHGYLFGEVPVCPQCNKNTEVYSRIVGYYRPVQNWNKGKKQEFTDRVTYKA